MLADAFNAIIEMASSPTFEYERPGIVGSFFLRAAISNYARNMNGPEEIIMEGREFVLSAKSFEGQIFTFPKRGDRLISSFGQENVISTIVEMRGFQGELLGYRVRTE